MDKFIPFSVRHGYVNPEEILKMNYESMTDELKIRMWNSIVKFLDMLEKRNKSLWEVLILDIWDKVFHKEVDTPPFRSVIGYGYTLNKNEFKRTFKTFKWSKVYDLVEFIFSFLSQTQRLKEYATVFQQAINQIFEEEYAPYRMVEGYVTPVTNEYEIQTIKEALKKADKYQPVKEHLEKALTHLSNRANPDYVNSIKESISALESLANLILNTSGKTLIQIHEKLCRQLKCPEPIKKQIKEYYDWASKEEGIRHGKIKGKSTIGQAEAKLFLVQTSGLVNYLISKSSQGVKND